MRLEEKNMRVLVFVVEFSVTYAKNEILRKKRGKSTSDSEVTTEEGVHA